MSYNFAADSSHTKKLCCGLSSSEVRFFTQIGRFAFFRPPVDFLLALIELFSLGVAAEVVQAIISSKSAILLQQGPVETKFQVEGSFPTNHSSSQ